MEADETYIGGKRKNMSLAKRKELKGAVDGEHYELWKRVRRTLFAVPNHFTTPTNIEGLVAIDIFTLNAPLASIIEE